MFDNTDIICIGESLIELSANESLMYASSLNKYFGGDTMTTAAAAAKLGAKVGYITVIGNDYLKDFLMDACTSEGLDTSQVRLSDGANGLYFVARCKVLLSCSRAVCFSYPASMEIVELFRV